MDSRRVFTDEFKREAVQMATERGNIAAAARDLGVSETCLHRWKQRLDHVPVNEVAFPGHGLPKDPERLSSGARTPGSKRSLRS